MDDFDELAGRTEGVARAVLVLAQLLQAAGVVDTPTLVAAWREQFSQAPGRAALRTADRTLGELAAALAQAHRETAPALSARRQAGRDLLH